MDAKDTLSARRFSYEKMQKVSLLETERMFADVYCLEPGQEQKVHKHDGADKVYFVLEGTGHFRIGDEERDLGPNQIVLAAAGTGHGVRNGGAEKLALLVFMAPNPNKR